MEEAMVSDRNRGWIPILGMLGAMLALLLSLYVGAYYVLVLPKIVVRKTGPIVIDTGTTRITASSMTVALPDLQPEYRWLPGSQSTCFFKPVHALDRRLRPGTWRQ
jgi:hypothetical protein